MNVTVPRDDHTYGGAVEGARLADTGICSIGLAMPL